MCAYVSILPQRLIARALPNPAAIFRDRVTSVPQEYSDVYIYCVGAVIQFLIYRGAGGEEGREKGDDEDDVLEVLFRGGSLSRSLILYARLVFYFAVY